MKITIYILFVIALIEVGSHFAVKIKYPQFGKSNITTNRQLSGYYVFKNTPHYSYPDTYKSEPHQTSIKHDQYGFICNEDWSISDSNSFRIFLAGGSAMLGAGQTYTYSEIVAYPNSIYAYEISIAGLLKAKLTEKYPSKKIQVINTAAFNRSMHQSFLLYLETLSKFDSDLIISMDGYNDTYNIEFDDDPFNDRESRWLEEYVKLEFLKQKRTISSFINFILLNQISKMYESKTESKVNFHSLKIDTTGLSNINDNILEDSKVNSNPERWLSILNSYQNVVQLNNTSFMFVLQPIINSNINKDISDNELKLLNLRRSYLMNDKLNMYIPLSAVSNPTDTLIDTLAIRIVTNKINEIKVTDLPHEVLYSLDLNKKFLTEVYAGDFSNTAEKQVIEAGGYYINMNRAIQNLDATFEFYTDYCHMTKEGNEKIAEILAIKIIENNLIQ